MTTGTSELTDWQAGKPCNLHDMAYCADCRDLAKIVRGRDGELHYKSDCAVSTFAEITGATYDEALAYVTAGGYRPGRGTPKDAVTGILQAAGYTARPSALTIEQAIAASRTGRAFWVSGSKGARGHAWSITDGVQHRPWQPPFRYRIFEVTA